MYCHGWCTRTANKSFDGGGGVRVHRKKRFTSFPSPAGMSLTKLPLGRTNSVMTSLFPSRESLVVTSRLGTGNSRIFFFYGVGVLLSCDSEDTGVLCANHSRIVFLHKPPMKIETKITTKCTSLSFPLTQVQKTVH